MSARAAWCRLLHIIAVDREAVPCGRWVEKKWTLSEIMFMASFRMSLLNSPGLFNDALWKAAVRLQKPRYRLEMRR